MDKHRCNTDAHLQHCNWSEITLLNAIESCSADATWELLLLSEYVYRERVPFEGGFLIQRQRYILK